MKNTYIKVYEKGTNAFQVYVSTTDRKNVYNVTSVPEIFEQETVNSILKVLRDCQYNLEAIWNGSGENTFNFKPVWLSYTPFVEENKEENKEETKTTDISLDILDALVEKNLENLKQARRKDQMLDWLTKTGLAEQNKYIPPFYEEAYLEALEKADYWAKIPEFPDYEINSTSGVVRKISTKKELNEIVTSGGKIYYSLYNKALYGNSAKMKAKAYLLAITFIPNTKLDEYNQVQYISERNVDKLTNLVWSNQSEATKKNWLKGMLEDQNLDDTQKQEIQDLVLSGMPYSYGKLSRKYNVHSFVISNFIKKLIAEKLQQKNEN